MNTSSRQCLFLTYEINTKLILEEMLYNAVFKLYTTFDFWHHRVTESKDFEEFVN